MHFNYTTDVLGFTERMKVSILSLRTDFVAFPLIVAACLRFLRTIQYMPQLHRVAFW